MTADRRQSPDRRTEPIGGRRDTDPLPDHGTRARYRTGCLCRLCKAAEAQYRADLRKDHARGVIRLGMHISAKETWQRIRQLRPEFGTYGALALHLGYKRPILEVNREAITVRTMLRVHRVHRLLLSEGPRPDGNI